MPTTLPYDSGTRSWDLLGLQRISTSRRPNCADKRKKR